ncbi:MAG TPA: rhodanese-like domain-containing protein [Actinomycetes bacterium]
MRIGTTARRRLARPYDTVTAPVAASLLEDGAVLVDVREPHEWRAGQVPNAQHIPLSQLSVRSRELPAGLRVVTVCRFGLRFARAAALLARDGRLVSNLAGGMRAWARADLPIAAQDGGVGRIA